MSHRSHQNKAVFVDASGRRSRFVKYGAALLGVSCVLFLGAVVAGLSGSGPAGGSLPWSGDSGGKPPVRAEHSPTPTDAPGPGRSVAPAAATESAEPTTPAPRTSAPASSSASAPAPTAATTSAPAPGNAEGNQGRGTPADPATGKGKKQ
ncbi:hypothetical protein [Streptomyces sp. NPDC055749]